MVPREVLVVKMGKAEQMALQVGSITPPVVEGFWVTVKMAQPRMLHPKEENRLFLVGWVELQVLMSVMVVSVAAALVVEIPIAVAVAVVVIRVAELVDLTFLGRPAAEVPTTRGPTRATLPERIPATEKSSSL